MCPRNSQVIDFVFGTEQAMLSETDSIGARIRNHQIENEPPEGQRPENRTNSLMDEVTIIGRWALVSTRPWGARSLAVLDSGGQLTRSILFLPSPQRRSTVRSPHPGDYRYRFKEDAVGCKFLHLIHSHSSAFLQITLACGRSIAQIGPGHHETSQANSITRFTDGRIKMRTKLTWYGPPGSFLLRIWR